jgi:DNA topoisomerase-6 subunit A
MLLRTMCVMDLIEDMIKGSKSSTLREMYYISEGWGKGKFHSQDESNLLAEDLEIVTGLMREDFKLRPEETGASVIGNITIEEMDRKGKKKRINCLDDVGDSGYGIPYNVEKDKVQILEAGADFIIAIETGGMFDRLVENGFAEDYNSVLVHLKGQPARSTRRFIKRLHEEMHLPVVVFTDGDPWSFRIFASVAYGAIKTAHISEYLATPTAEFIGITASDIENYKLPTDKLTERDTKALEAELKDPRFADEFWRNEIDLMLKLNKKAEQQALAKYGLDYVTDKYLPEKLGELGIAK